MMAKHGLMQQLSRRFRENEAERVSIGLAAHEHLRGNNEQIAMLLTIFRSKQNAARWLTSPVDALGGEVPLVLIAEGKEDLVVDVLLQIRTGMCV